jgi:hypothetical protein
MKWTFAGGLATYGNKANTFSKAGRFKEIVFHLKIVILAAYAA